MSDLIQITGKSYWANVFTMNKLSNKFQVNIGNLDEKSKDILKKVGLTLKDKGDEMGEYLIAKSMYVPRVVDSKNRRISPDTHIGNGSKINVKIKPYHYKSPNTGATGVGAGLQAIQVIELVEYENKMFDDTEGFEVSGYSGELTPSVLLEDDIDFDEEVLPTKD